MQKISAETYADLVQTSKVLEQDGYGEKVLLTSDGQIVKIFRLKRLLSGALLYPYAYRFANNAKKIRQRGITTITVDKIAHCRQPKRDLVWYQPIPGDTLRDYCQNTDIATIVESLAQFVAQLHHKGILFRSIHWGNIIVADDLSLGLIDIADIRFQGKPLSLTQRQRNFRHFLRYPADNVIFDTVAAQFWSAYQQAAHLSVAQCQQLQQS